jgi:hypothetical protein
VFAQTIRAKTSDSQSVRAAVQRWMQDIGPTAKGWLGSTGGVTDDGDLFVLVRFDSEGSARFNSARPEQDKWWSEFSKLLDGEATFKDSNNLLVETNGDPDSAQFVQVILGQSTDLNRSREILTENLRGRQSARPDILGSVSVGHEDGKFTSVLYFMNEVEARKGESQDFPPDVRAALEEMRSLAVGTPEYLDIRDPWINSPK